MYHYYSRFQRVQPSVVAFAKGDVTGDGVPDDVYLTGVKAADGGPYIQQITLHVRDGRTGAPTSVPLTENSGYNPTLFLGDFTGNRVADILIRINTGGSGAITNDYVYSFARQQAQLLFDSQVYNEQYDYDVEYRNYFKVDVTSKSNRRKYVIDISTREASYLNEIYHPNGELKNPITGFVNPLSGLYPVDFDSNGVYELLAYQRIAGRYNADGLGYVLNTLGWQGNRFILENQYVAVFGATV